MIALEELKVERFDLVAKWLSDSGINRWLTSDWRGRTVTTTVIALAVRNPRNRMFVILYDGRPCGLAALADIDRPDKTAMVWFFLGEANLGGKGITSEAVRLLARLAFKEMELDSLYAWAMDDNNPSHMVLQKAGFALAGRIRCATRSGKRQVDRVYYDLVADSCP